MASDGYRTYRKDEPCPDCGGTDFAPVRSPKGRAVLAGVGVVGVVAAPFTLGVGLALAGGSAALALARPKNYMKCTECKAVFQRSLENSSSTP